jgi:hypothetical protein
MQSKGNAQILAAATATQKELFAGINVMLVHDCCVCDWRALLLLFS